MEEKIFSSEADEQEYNAMSDYLKDGEVRALNLKNRGPIRFDTSGSLATDIFEAYSQYGFYIFTNVIEREELEDIEFDLFQIKAQLPFKKGADLDSAGRPAIGATCKAPTLFWSKPLGDPFGGTDYAGGRHPVKMFEPKPKSNVLDEVVYLILGSLQFSEACLRTYGHPQLLKVAAAINGEDFVPFSEALFIKEPGKGASVAWHRDGVTHWDNPKWNKDIHGFNFMAQLFGCTAANGVWVVPGTHKTKTIDIKEMVAKAGSVRLPDAVPMICDPGDVVISNRQVLHGSFANTSPDWRVTINQGFHRRSSVLGVTAKCLQNDLATYDENRIHKRSILIGQAIDARRQRFPNEQPYVYKPLEGLDKVTSWKNGNLASLHDYNLLDLGL